MKEARGQVVKVRLFGMHRIGDLAIHEIVARTSSERQSGL
jgi:hypothetical protein